MKCLLFLLAVFFTAPVSLAQNTFIATIKNQEGKQPVAGATATVKNTSITATSDASGKLELSNIPDGEQVIEVSSPGYETKELKVTFPLADNREQVILIRVNNELGEVTITST